MGLSFVCACGISLPRGLWSASVYRGLKIGRTLQMSLCFKQYIIIYSTAGPSEFPAKR